MACRLGYDPRGVSWTRTWTFIGSRSISLSLPVINCLRLSGVADVGMSRAIASHFINFVVNLFEFKGSILLHSKSVHTPVCGTQPFTSSSLNPGRSTILETVANSTIEPTILYNFALDQSRSWRGLHCKALAVVRLVLSTFINSEARQHEINSV